MTLAFAWPPILVLMGVAGSGKSTVGGLVAGRLGWDLQEGDDLHPPQNLAKMAAGQPLSDSDRAPWLASARTWIDAHVADGQPGVLTCSALKRAYRDALARENVVFVHLHGDRAQLLSRLAARHGHFMPASLLDSQLADLEPPDPDENALTVDIAASPSGVAAAILDKLALD